jgi:hypothetical protein
MRVEINSEVESGDPALEIPWASPRKRRLKYVDLNKHPEKIASLPECRNHPPLAQLLHRINSSGSAFRTAKCDVWVTAKLEEDEELDFQLPVKVGSYVDLVFERRDYRSHLEPHLRFAKKLEKSLAACRLPAQMDIVVRQCLFRENRKWGYSLTLFVHAYGATRSQAKEAWGCALDNLGNALLKISPSLIKNRAKRLDPRTRGAI